MAAAVPAVPDLAAGVPLALEHLRVLEAELAPLRARLGSACLSEFAFSNLYLFRHAHVYRYLPGPWPCVAGVTYDGVRHLLPLFDLAQAPPQVLEDLLDGRDCFFPVAAEMAQALDPTRFVLTACAADADYLYRAESFRQYRGDLLRKKRQLMRQLLRHVEVTSTPLTAARIGDARSLLAAWMQDKGKGQGEADELACHEALTLLERFGLDGRLYYANGAPAGFIIAQRLNPETAVMRFAKGSDAFKGIYQFMFHDYAVNAPGIAWINFEQDLGLPNFRQTKRSYAPHLMLDKVRVSLRR